MPAFTIFISGIFLLTTAVGAEDETGEPYGLMDAPPSVESKAVGSASVDPSALKKAVVRAGRYLIATQHKYGYWGVGSDRHSATWDNAHIRIAITAYAVEALEKAAVPGGEKSIQKGLEYIDDLGLKDENDLRDDNKTTREYGYSVFGGNNNRPYALALGLATAVRRGDSDKIKRYTLAIKTAKYGDQYLRHDRSDDPLKNVKGTFQLGLLAMSLLETKAKGYTLPEGLLEGTVSQIKASRRSNGTFPYDGGVKQGKPVSLDGPIDDSARKDGIARDALCSLVLYKAGEGGKNDVERAVKVFIAYRSELALQLNKKILTHDYSKHAWAKYYYLFGIYWTSRALSELDGPEVSKWADSLAASLIAMQNADGSWVDSPEAGGPHYGAAMGLLSLDLLSAKLK